MITYDYYTFLMQTDFLFEVKTPTIKNSIMGYNTVALYLAQTEYNDECQNTTYLTISRVPYAIEFR